MAFPLASLLSIGEKVIDRVLPSPEAKAQAMLELKKLEKDGRLDELQADMNEQDNLTERAKADMASDSWLSKNIRPMTLIFILVVYTVFAMMSAYGYNANESYVTLLGQWGMLIMSFYFGGRTLEKILAMKGQK
jgi:hypothetical protein